MALLNSARLNALASSGTLSSVTWFWLSFTLEKEIQLTTLATMVSATAAKKPAYIRVEIREVTEGR